MKRILKYFLVAVLTLSFAMGVNAEAIGKENIDFEGEMVTYDKTTGKFKAVITDNTTLLYQDVQVGDSETAKELTNAYNAYLSSPTEENQTSLLVALGTENINDTEWSDTQKTSLTSGILYVRWVKVTNSETNTTKYAFGLYKVAGETPTQQEEKNPSTGISPLYVIPVMAILGAGLVFKKRRYE